MHKKHFARKCLLPLNVILRQKMILSNPCGTAPVPQKLQNKCVVRKHPGETPDHHPPPCLHAATACFASSSCLTPKRFVLTTTLVSIAANLNHANRRPSVGPSRDLYSSGKFYLCFTLCSHNSRAARKATWVHTQDSGPFYRG